MVHECNFDALNAIDQVEFVEAGDAVIVAAGYPKCGDADIKYFRSKYCYVATDVEVVYITRSYRPLPMLLPATALKFFGRVEIHKRMRSHCLIYQA